MKLLDTNVCISVLRRDRTVSRRFVEEMLAGELGVSAITIFELAYGARRSSRAREEIEKIDAFVRGGPQIVSFEPADAGRAGAIRAQLAASGRTIGAYDILIAGQAQARGLLLVTANQREFARIEGLELEDWTSG